ncbi:MAG: RNA 2',3'-cyclic phosphodiesterase, partial [Betaproteobacteria bacterium]
FSPHVTLARRSGRPGEAAMGMPISWTATRVALYASAAGAGGPRYRELDGWPLAGAGPGSPMS